MLFDGASYENVTGPVVLRRHHRYAHTCQRGPVADRRIKYSSRRRQVPSLNRQPLFVQTGCKSRAEMGGRGGSNADRSRAALPWCWFDLAIGTATPSPVFIAITFMKRSRRSPPPPRPNRHLAALAGSQISTPLPALATLAPSLDSIGVPSPSLVPDCQPVTPVFAGTNRCLSGRFLKAMTQEAEVAMKEQRESRP